MLGRRAFLESASLALISAAVCPTGVIAQDPKPRSKAKARVKTTGALLANPLEKPLEPDEQINRILAQARTDGRRMPGMVGGIIQGEELTQVGAVGIRKIGSPEPFLVSDLVHLGSCTKAMTATMIGTLVDEGKLGWDWSIAKIFPEWASTTHPEFRAVTLHQLLAHRGGFGHDLAWYSMRQAGSVSEQRRMLLSEALKDAPEIKPGTDYHYSNVGYVLAGLMAEQVMRSSWEDLMIKRVFQPLGMTTAGFGVPGTRGKVDQPWGHRVSGDTVEAIRMDNSPTMGPAGTVHCSLRDWAKFAALHLGGSVAGVTLVKPETLKALHLPREGENYAGGWLVTIRSSSAGPTLTHNGSNTLWYCSIWLDTGRKLGYLVATNAAGRIAEEACQQAIDSLRRYANPNDRPRRR
jgi:CubicO group peptidase (beta-lactamase class C family)